MKVKVDWKALGKALWAAVKPVLLAAIGGGIVSVVAGCSSLVPTSKTQTLSVVGIGIPAIAVVSSSSQGADASGKRKSSNKKKTAAEAASVAEADEKPMEEAGPETGDL